MPEEMAMQVEGENTTSARGDAIQLTFVENHIVYKFLLIDPTSGVIIIIIIIGIIVSG